MTTSTLAALAVLTAAWSLLAPSSEPGSVMRQRIDPVAGGMTRAVGTFTALAPDGSSMVYALSTEDGEGRHLWLTRR